jgi:hypothetical protein
MLFAERLRDDLRRVRARVEAQALQLEDIRRGRLGMPVPERIPDPPPPEPPRIASLDELRTDIRRSLEVRIPQIEELLGDARASATALETLDHRDRGDATAEVGRRTLDEARRAQRWADAKAWATSAQGAAILLSAATGIGSAATVLVHVLARLAGLELP